MPDKESPKNLILSPPDANVLVRFVGELNGNIKFIEKSFKVKVFQNGNKLKITGHDEDVKLASDALKKLYDCLLYTSPSPRDKRQSRMPSSA